MIATLIDKRTNRRKDTGPTHDQTGVAVRRLRIGAPENHRFAPQVITAATASQAKRVSFVLLRRIESDGRTFVLKRPILVQLDFRDGWWTHDYEPWGIAGYGETVDASLGEFSIYFGCTWDGLADECDANLTVEAQKLKDLLRSQVKAIE